MASDLKLVFSLAALCLVAFLLVIGVKYYKKRKQHHTKR